VVSVKVRILVSKGCRIEYRVTDASRAMPGNNSASPDRGIFLIPQEWRYRKAETPGIEMSIANSATVVRKCLFPRHVLEAKNAIPEIAKSDA
jgi:hypothetical protein